MQVRASCLIGIVGPLWPPQVVAAPAISSSRWQPQITFFLPSACRPRGRLKARQSADDLVMPLAHPASPRAWGGACGATYCTQLLRKRPSLYTYLQVQVLWLGAIATTAELKGWAQAERLRQTPNLGPVPHLAILSLRAGCPSAEI
jgi:hypothetical protein